MARYRGPKLRIIRRLGTPIPGLMRTDPELRRPYPPGQHGPTRRKKLSDYAFRLMEKQKLRFHYCLSEKQLKRYVTRAFSQNGNSATNLLSDLECRLDNVAFRMGLAPTMPAARQLTTHAHLTVNGSRVNIPSYRLKKGDVVALSEKSNWKERVEELIGDPNNLETPSYLEVDGKGSATIIEQPTPEHCPVVIDPQLIIEYYSGK